MWNFVMKWKNVWTKLLNSLLLYIAIFTGIIWAVFCGCSMPTSAVACTPLGRTPVARISSLRGSLYSDTVKRNLLDCMPPPPMEGGKCSGIVYTKLFIFTITVNFITAILLQNIAKWWYIKKTVVRNCVALPWDVWNFIIFR